ncbi:MAG: amylo-alpha-1,6-glucosidase [Bacteroidia bacterium]
MQNSPLSFDTAQLFNLPFALKRELFRAQSNGIYTFSTLLQCHTRKYHALLASYVGQQPYILLSQGLEFLAHQEEKIGITPVFYGREIPESPYRFLQNLVIDPFPRWYFRWGQVFWQREILLLSSIRAVLLRYVFESVESPLIFSWHPLLGLRGGHTLHTEPWSISFTPPNLPTDVGTLRFITLPVGTWQAAPTSHENIFYPEEANRGYAAHENLFSPGAYVWKIHEPTEIFIVCSLDPLPESVPKLYEKEIGHRPLRGMLKEALHASAPQFIWHKGQDSFICAGYPWFGAWGRDSAISVVGLTLVRQEWDSFHKILQTLLRYPKKGLIPNVFPDQYHSVDASLWLIWAVSQAYVHLGGDGAAAKELYDRYGEALETILAHLQTGSLFGVRQAENGLLWIPSAVPVLHWMDAMVEGVPVVPRYGFLVEINALWYHALRFMAEITPHAGRRARWENAAAKAQSAFKSTFWRKEKGYLADFVTPQGADWTIRPNQIFAVSMLYRPIADKIAELILSVVQNDLLTPRGLRTLSPKDPRYRGVYEGDQKQRDLAYHQGTVWPWLLGAYVEGMLNIMGPSVAPQLRRLWEGFQPTLMEAGIGHISEIYDGDPPHAPKGAIAQAWSTAELLRIDSLLRRCGY